MKRRRIDLALAAIMASGVALAVVWPHAREAGAVLAAQDDPVELSDIEVSSALRNNQNIVADQIKAALAAGDTGLAESFVELARAKNITLPDGLSGRVGEAVVEAGTASHLARRFASGLVTGNADDAASLSGTVAGDLFVFGDVRDVVREASISSWARTPIAWCWGWRPRASR